VTSEAWVRLWGRRIGAVVLEDGRDVASFQYEPGFADSGIEVSPLVMPLSRRVHAFPELARKSFRGLPGLLADSLPDRFGNALINAWLATQGRTPDSFNAVERLCYIGRRGMGALEFAPVLGPGSGQAGAIEIGKLVELATEILTERTHLSVSFDEESRKNALRDILRVGTSAGGARAKAVIAWNRSTNEVRSGQLDADEGFEHWLLKFGGVRGNRDKELDDPMGYGAIEYACYLMARDCGIEMNECRLFEENGRRHFMTRRFDRSRRGEKIHMQSLGALAHYDFNLSGAFSYEQAFLIIRQLGLPQQAIEQQYLRMVFNLVIRNQDDHVKNIAFLMDKQGQWSLSPAFDVTYSYNPEGPWTAHHQMTMNGKSDDFAAEDFKASARVARLKRGQEKRMISRVVDVVTQWPAYAAAAGIDKTTGNRIRREFRLAGFDPV
jgi:serine/threonine-protein kinase HipA